jgi:hypothetical protein
VKSAVIFSLALLTAAPAAVAFVPAEAHAQVLAGSNAARRPPIRREPGLSARDRERLYDAQDAVIEHEEAITELTSVTEAGGALNEQQARQLADRQRRLAAAQRTVAELEAKNERLGG